ncbi:spore maturation protein [Clostridioides difficile]|nr:spore maturation protein [Clostridioides difficile]
MEIFSNLLIPIIILYIVVYGKYKKIDVYDSFVKGAIDGLKAAWDILPYIIGIFLAIGIFKTGKGLDMFRMAIYTNSKYDEYTKRIIGLISVKPLSGSGALGMYSELANRVGIGSLVEKMGATIVGSSETIFYTMAIYYGSLR